MVNIYRGSYESPSHGDCSGRQGLKRLKTSKVIALFQPKFLPWKRTPWLRPLEDTAVVLAYYTLQMNELYAKLIVGAIHDEHCVYTVTKKLHNTSPKI